jgi:hypothetical protein
MVDCWVHELACPWCCSVGACSVIMRSLDVGVNVDGVINMVHDYTQVARRLSWLSAVRPCSLILALRGPLGLGTPSVV